jgi:hypothetical protein
MRKLIWLALGLGAAELLKRQAQKRGISTTDLVSNFAHNTLARLKGQPDSAPPPPAPRPAA